MRKYNLVAMSFLLLMCLAPSLMAQNNSPGPTKEENIRKLLILTDAKGIFKRALETQVSQMKTNMVNRIPPKFWDEVLKAVDADKFMELLVPVYDKHFSNDELLGLIAFYETPLGKRLVSELPQIMTESAAAGDKYGQEIANQVIQRMQAEGTFPSAAPAGDGKPMPPRR
jgi:hypothetical protein